MEIEIISPKTITRPGVDLPARHTVAAPRRQWSVPLKYLRRDRGDTEYLSQEPADDAKSQPGACTLPLSVSESHSQLCDSCVDSGRTFSLPASEKLQWQHRRTVEALLFQAPNIPWPMLHQGDFAPPSSVVEDPCQPHSTAPHTADASKSKGDQIACGKGSSGTGDINVLGPQARELEQALSPRLPLHGSEAYVVRRPPTADGVRTRSDEGYKNPEESSLLAVVLSELEEPDTEPGKGEEDFIEASKGSEMSNTIGAEEAPQAGYEQNANGNDLELKKSAVTEDNSKDHIRYSDSNETDEVEKANRVRSERLHQHYEQGEIRQTIETAMVATNEAKICCDGCEAYHEGDRQIECRDINDDDLPKTCETNHEEDNTGIERQNSCNTFLSEYTFGSYDLSSDLHLKGLNQKEIASVKQQNEVMQQEARDYEKGSDPTEEVTTIGACPVCPDGKREPLEAFTTKDRNTGSSVDATPCLLHVQECCQQSRHVTRDQQLHHNVYDQPSVEHMFLPPSLLSSQPNCLSTEHKEVSPLSNCKPASQHNDYKHSEVEALETTVTMNEDVKHEVLETTVTRNEDVKHEVLETKTSLSGMTTDSANEGSHQANNEVDITGKRVILDVGEVFEGKESFEKGVRKILPKLPRSKVNETKPAADMKEEQNAGEKVIARDDACWETEEGEADRHFAPEGYVERREEDNNINHKSDIETASDFPSGRMDPQLAELRWPGRDVKRTEVCKEKSKTQTLDADWMKRTRLSMEMHLKLLPSIQTDQVQTEAVRKLNRETRMYALSSCDKLPLLQMKSLTLSSGDSGTSDGLQRRGWPQSLERTDVINDYSLSSRTYRAEHPAPCVAGVWACSDTEGTAPLYLPRPQASRRSASAPRVRKAPLSRQTNQKPSCLHMKRDEIRNQHATVVHEQNSPKLLNAVGEHKKNKSDTSVYVKCRKCKKIPLRNGKSQSTHKRGITGLPRLQHKSVQKPDYHSKVAHIQREHARKVTLPWLERNTSREILKIVDTGSERSPRVFVRDNKSVDRNLNRKGEGDKQAKGQEQRLTRIKRNKLRDKNSNKSTHAHETNKSVSKKSNMSHFESRERPFGFLTRKSRVVEEEVLRIRKEEQRKSLFRELKSFHDLDVNHMDSPWEGLPLESNHMLHKLLGGTWDTEEIDNEETEDDDAAISPEQVAQAQYGDGSLMQDGSGEGEPASSQDPQKLDETQTLTVGKRSTSDMRGTRELSDNLSAKPSSAVGARSTVPDFFQTVGWDADSVDGSEIVPGALVEHDMPSDYSSLDPHADEGLNEVEVELKRDLSEPEGTGSKPPELVHSDEKQKHEGHHHHKAKRVRHKKHRSHSVESVLSSNHGRDKKHKHIRRKKHVSAENNSTGTESKKMRPMVTSVKEEEQVKSEDEKDAKSVAVPDSPEGSSIRVNIEAESVENPVASKEVKETAQASTFTSVPAPPETPKEKTVGEQDAEQKKEISEERAVIGKGPDKINSGKGGKMAGNSAAKSNKTEQSTNDRKAKEKNKSGILCDACQKTEEEESKTSSCGNKGEILTGICNYCGCKRGLRYLSIGNPCCTDLFYPTSSHCRGRTRMGSVYQPPCCRRYEEYASSRDTSHEKTKTLSPDCGCAKEKGGAPPPRSDPCKSLKEKSPMMNEKNYADQEHKTVAFDGKTSQRGEKISAGENREAPGEAAVTAKKPAGAEEKERSSTTSSGGAGDRKLRKKVIKSPGKENDFECFCRGKHDSGFPAYTAEAQKRDAPSSSAKTTGRVSPCSDQVKKPEDKNPTGDEAGEKLGGEEISKGQIGENKQEEDTLVRVKDEKKEAEKKPDGGSTVKKTEEGNAAASVAEEKQAKVPTGPNVVSPKKDKAAAGNLICANTKDRSEKSNAPDYRHQEEVALVGAKLKTKEPNTRNGLSPQKGAGKEPAGSGKLLTASAASPPCKPWVLQEDSDHQKHTKQTSPRDCLPKNLDEYLMQYLRPGRLEYSFRRQASFEWKHGCYAYDPWPSMRGSGGYESCQLKPRKRVSFACSFPSCFESACGDICRDRGFQESWTESDSNSRRLNGRAQGNKLGCSQHRRKPGKVKPQSPPLCVNAVTRSPQQDTHTITRFEQIKAKKVYPSVNNGKRSLQSSQYTMKTTGIELERPCPCMNAMKGPAQKKKFPHKTMPVPKANGTPTKAKPDNMPSPSIANEAKNMKTDSVCEKRTVCLASCKWSPPNSFVCSCKCKNPCIGSVKTSMAHHTAKSQRDPQQKPNASCGCVGQRTSPRIATYKRSPRRGDIHCGDASPDTQHYRGANSQGRSQRDHSTHFNNKDPCHHPANSQRLFQQATDSHWTGINKDPHYQYASSQKRFQIFDDQKGDTKAGQYHHAANSHRRSQPPKDGNCRSGSPESYHHSTNHQRRLQPRGDINCGRNNRGESYHHSVPSQGSLTSCKNFSCGDVIQEPYSTSAAENPKYPPTRTGKPPESCYRAMRSDHQRHFQPLQDFDDANPDTYHHFQGRPKKKDIFTYDAISPNRHKGPSSDLEVGAMTSHLNERDVQLRRDPRRSYRCKSPIRSFYGPRMDLTGRYRPRTHCNEACMSSHDFNKISLCLHDFTKASLSLHDLKKPVCGSYDFKFHRSFSNLRRRL